MGNTSTFHLLDLVQQFKNVQELSTYTSLLYDFYSQMALPMLNSYQFILELNKTHGRKW